MLLADYPLFQHPSFSMTKIAAIDFETANNRPNSACQIGIVVLNDFEVVEKKVWLIRPPELYFSPFCVRVHGITARDCIDAPTWSELWPEIKLLLQGAVLLGHNVGFDARVLEASCSHLGIDVPSHDLLCSRVVAKRAWPELPGHGLANVAQHLNIRFKHHDALEDAIASAEVVSQAAKLADASCLTDLEVILGLIRGSVRAGSVKVPRTARLPKSSQLSSLHSKNVATSVREPSPQYNREGIPRNSADAIRKAKQLSQAILSAAKPFQPLAGHHMVLVHSILGLDHDDAIYFLQELGATVYSRINLKTRTVILGTSAKSQSTAPLYSGGLFSTDSVDDVSDLTLDSRPQDGADEGFNRILEDIEKRKALGQSIRVISQRQLLALIPSASEIVRGE